VRGGADASRVERERREEGEKGEEKRRSESGQLF
jgi:hypothetical protein